MCGKVFLIGFVVFLLGGFGQVGFQVVGFEGFLVGIVVEVFLIVIVVVWISFYLFCVVIGQMIYMDQWCCYCEVYDKQEVEVF